MCQVMPFALAVAAMPLVAAGAAQLPPNASHWRNSTEGIHAFLTFDSAVNATEAQQYGGELDFVWGADQVAMWRTLGNPSIILSRYIPFTRDPNPHGHLDKNNSGLAWWQANHPEMVLYECDKKTPAWECFAGEGCAHVSVPLDLMNPGTLEVQMSLGVYPALADGYNAIAFDNYGLNNQWAACGSYSGPNGAWVQRYGQGGTDPKTDPQYALDVLNWTARVVDRIHAAGMLMIPNYSEMDLGNEQVLEVFNLTDGMLAEAGFAEWDPVPNTSSFTTPPPKTNPTKFKMQVEFIRNLQRYGKGFFAINEWGAGPDYGLNPSKIPYNITGDANRAIRQFVVAAFMMTNGGTSGIYLTCIQCYGGNAGGAGGLSLWPEYNATVGHALEEPSMDAATGVWQRRHSSGLAVVNPDDSNTVQFSVPAPPTGMVWESLYGDRTPSSVALAPASGLVLVAVPP